MLAQNHKYDPFRHIHESFDLCVDAGRRSDAYLDIAYVPKSYKLYSVIYLGIL